MKIDKFKVRTLTSPTHGVTFDKADNARISEAARVLSNLDEKLSLVMRLALAREILQLDELSDWTNGEAEDLRRERQESALISYQATFEGNVAARFLAAQKKGDEVMTAIFGEDES